MGLAALSTSAIALTASPAPAPSTAVPAAGAEAFAQLVAQASPEDKSAQDGGKPDGSPEAETDIAATADETDVAPMDDAARVALTDQPINLLAEIEAMVTAASQIGVSPPASIVGATPTITPVAVVDAPEAEATMVASRTAPLRTHPVVAAVMSQAATPAAAAAAAAASSVIAEQTAIAAPAMPAVVPTSAEPVAKTALSAEPMSGLSAEVPTSQPGKAASGNLAALLASLKSVFQNAPATVGSAAALPAAAVKPADTGIAQALQAQAILAPTAGSGAKTGAEAGVAPILDGEAAVPAAVMPARPAVQAVVSADPPPSIAPATATAKNGTVAVPAADTAKPKIELAAVAPAPHSTAIVGDSKADDAATPATGSTDASTPAPTPGPAVTTIPTPVAPLSNTSAATETPAVADSGDATLIAPSEVDQTIARHLHLARDQQWLDQLARDISQVATRDGQLKFQLNPEHLGALTVEISNDAAGTAIRMTAETDQARSIIADAQPRLLAEVRAQGLRVSESHVDLNQQQGGNSQNGSASASAHGHAQQQRQPSEDSKPFGRTQTAVRDEAADSASRDDGELYA